MVHHLKGVDQFISVNTSTNKREVMALKEMGKNEKDLKNCFSPYIVGISLNLILCCSSQCSG